MAKAKMSYLELARQKAKEKASTAKTGKNDQEFTPGEAGKYRIRLLPPLKADEGQLPYHTHSFHFLPGTGKDKKGEYVYSKKYYGDDEAAYFNWLQKAAFIKMHAPDIQIEELTPQTMARPLNRIIKAKI